MGHDPDDGEGQRPRPAVVDQHDGHARGQVLEQGQRGRVAMRVARLDDDGPVRGKARRCLWCGQAPRHHPHCDVGLGLDPHQQRTGEVGQVALDPESGPAPAQLASLRRTPQRDRRREAWPRSGEPPRPAGPRRAVPPSPPQRSRAWIERTSAASLSGPMHSRSAPAISDSTAASGMPRSLLAPAMSSASETMTPSNPSAERRCPSTRGLSVAGRSGSSAVTTMCEVITDAAPAAIAAGTAPARRRVSTSCRASIVGSARWLSVSVSPCPGKCLSAGRHPGGLQSLDPGHDVSRDVGGIRAEAAGADDGVVGVAVHVGDGPEVEVDAEPRAPYRPWRRWRVNARSSTAPSAAAPRTGLPDA